MRVTQYRIEGLGHLSTLVTDESSGVAAVVDPRRDVDIYLDAARAGDLRITHVVETHLHNDYVSGGRELAALTGATHVIGAGARLAHEDSVMVYPTHGAGSLCSTGISSTSWSTIGFERRHDPLLAPMEVDAFAHALLTGQPTIPRYFARMRPTNQAGPRLLGGVAPTIEPLSGEELERALDRGAVVVDARATDSHAMARIPGSLSIPAGTS